MSVSKVPELFEFNAFTNNLTNEQLDLVLRYFDFLRALIEDNQQKAALNMVSSLVYYLVECKATYPKKKHALTRAEQICGQFITLVELHCREQHRVEWYAGQMCLAPKYLSNVVKQTLDTSPNRCIDQALLRQAKSLLSSTSLSVQQISDQLGFLNQSHFGTFFRRQTNCSPKDFRLQLSGK
ncbi:MAG: helix-turn-helix transcriptional regulator [Paludibacteraceae bacterium]|nr:helix-turn-helix transcriptional regulator [Paludibacteraceae bacterium]